MEPSKFDELTKTLATSTSRRQALKTLAATAVGGILGLAGIGTAFANCKPNGIGCNTSNQCCSGGCCHGTCTDLGTTTNCGACGHSCASGQGCCNGMCTDLNTTQNCGSCGNTCGANQTCQNGMCVTNICTPNGQPCDINNPGACCSLCCECIGNNSCTCCNF